MEPRSPALQADSSPAEPPGKPNAEYIMRNARLDETQAGIKIAGRNISDLRYEDNTTLMAESKKGNKEPLDESERPE